MRARIDALVDHGTFVELGTLAGDGTRPVDAFVAGSGLLDGRPVLVGAEDFTVAGGSIGTPAGTRCARLAALAAHRPAPNDRQLLADLAGLMPTVAIVSGPPCRAR